MRVEKPFFGTLADCKKVRKTSTSRLSAYIDTVRRELRKIMFNRFELQQSDFYGIVKSF